MHNHNFRKMLWASLVTGFILTACDKSDNVGPVQPETSTADKYVLAVKGKEANYLLTVDDLSKGETTIVGNGLEAGSGSTWVFANYEKLFNLQYNQGSNAGAEYYFLHENGKLGKSDNLYSISRYNSYGLYNEYVITTAAADMKETDAAGNVKKGVNITYLNSVNGETKVKSIDGENYFGNGEYVNFAGILQSGNSIYLSAIGQGLSIYGVQAEGGKYVSNPSLVATEAGGEKSAAYKAGEIPGTQYPNEAWVAVYDDKDFSGKPTLIKTDKISYACGRFKSAFYQTIWADADGDIYVFSPNFSRILGRLDAQRSKLPAGVVRIKKGTKAFDTDYYVNLEALAGGVSFLRCWPAGGSYFLLQMYNTAEGMQARSAADANRLALFDVKTQKLTFVTGLPGVDKLSSFGSTPFAENGKVYIPVTTNDGEKPAVYVIDTATAKAVKGISVEGSSIEAVGKLQSTK